MSQRSGNVKQITRQRFGVTLRESYCQQSLEMLPDYLNHDVIRPVFILEKSADPSVTNRCFFYLQEYLVILTNLVCAVQLNFSDPNKHLNCYRRFWVDLGWTVTQSLTPLLYCKTGENRRRARRFIVKEKESFKIEAKSVCMNKTRGIHSLLLITW